MSQKLFYVDTLLSFVSRPLFIRLTLLSLSGINFLFLALLCNVLYESFQYFLHEMPFL